MRNLFTGLRASTTNQIRNPEHNVEQEEKAVIQNNRNYVRSVMDLAHQKQKKTIPQSLNKPVPQKQLNDKVSTMSSNIAIDEADMSVSPSEMGRVNYLKPVSDPYDPKIKKRSVVDLKTRNKIKPKSSRIKLSNNLYKEMRKKVRVYNYKVNGDMVARKTEHQPATLFDPS